MMRLTEFVFDRIQNLAVVLVNFLESALGEENFNSETKMSWNRMLDAIIKVIETGLEIKPKRGFLSLNIISGDKVLLLFVCFSIAYIFGRRKNLLTI